MVCVWMHARACDTHRSTHPTQPLTQPPHPSPQTTKKPQEGAVTGVQFLPLRLAAQIGLWGDEDDDDSEDDESEEEEEGSESVRIYIYINIIYIYKYNIYMYVCVRPSFVCVGSLIYIYFSPHHLYHKHTKI